MGKIQELAVDAKDDWARRISNELGMSIPEAMRGILFSAVTAGFGDMKNVYQERKSGNKRGVLFGGNKRKTELMMTMEFPDGTKITLAKSQVDHALNLDAAKQDKRVKEALERMQAMFNGPEEGVIDV